MTHPNASGNVMHEYNDSNIFYRPQTKFAKAMFSQVSVCPQGGLCPGGSLSGGLCPGVSVRETPLVQLRAGSTHPTGIHSCSKCASACLECILNSSGSVCISV